MSQWEQDVIEERTERVLFKLGDFLGVNARWIALGDAPISRPMFPTPDEADLLEAFRSLPEQAQDELLSKAHEYQRVAGKTTPTTANPYPKRK